MIKIIHGKLGVLSRMELASKKRKEKPFVDAVIPIGTQLRSLRPSGPNYSRTFEGFCFFCSNPMHSQKWCPLRYCSLCRQYGHADFVCPNKSASASAAGDSFESKLSAAL